MTSTTRIAIATPAEIHAVRVEERRERARETLSNSIASIADSSATTESIAARSSSRSARFFLSSALLRRIFTVSTIGIPFSSYSSTSSTSEMP